MMHYKKCILKKRVSFDTIFWQVPKPGTWIVDRLFQYGLAVA
jgi:hypothetical protein